MSTHPTPVIAIGGENLIDTVNGLSPAGEPMQTDNLGGSPYNVAVALARQGHRPQYLTPISTDGYGTMLAENLAHQGVMAVGPRVDAPTTQAIVTLKDGVPEYEFRRDGTAERRVTTAIIAAAMPADATHFHIGSLAFAGGPDAQAWEEAFHAAAKRGVTTSLDPNVRASLIEDPVAYRARMSRLLASAAIVKLSDEDLEWLYPGLDQSAAMDRLLGTTNAGFVALTKGPEGAACWTKAAHFSVDNPAVPDLKDTIGAGDTFMATLLAQLAGLDLSELGSGNLPQVLRRAVFAACLNCTKEGCDPPTTAVLDAALARGTI